MTAKNVQSLIELPQQRSPPQISRKIPKKDLGGASDEGVYIRQEPFANMTFFKVDLKCFPMEQSLSQINYRFSWSVQIRCRKPHFENRKT